MAADVADPVRIGVRERRVDDAGVTLALRCTSARSDGRRPRASVERGHRGLRGQ